MDLVNLQRDIVQRLDILLAEKVILNSEKNELRDLRTNSLGQSISF